MSFLEEPAKLSLDEYAFIQLKHARRWAAFLSITLLAFFALLISAGVVMVIDLMRDMTFVMVLFPVMALVYTLPAWYLYRFSHFSKKAILQQNNFALGRALKCLKYHYCGMALLTALIVIIFVGGTVIGPLLRNIPQVTEGM